MDTLALPELDMPRLVRVRRPRWRRWGSWFVDALGILGGLASILLFSYGLIRCRMDHVPEVDSQGYYLMGRAFSEGHWPRWDEDFSRFSGHPWVKVANGRVMSKYPPGWPLLLAVGYRAGEGAGAGGIEGAMWVNRVLAIVGAVAMFLLAWQLFNSAVAFICTAAWLFSPMLMFYVGYPLSHSADVTFVLLAMLFVTLWAKRGWTWCAILGGFCTGFLPLIRPTTVLIWPAIAAMGLAMLTADRPAGKSRWLRVRLRQAWRDLRERRVRCLWMKPYRAIALGIVAGALPLAFLAFYNWSSFGAPWRTGYSLTGEQSAFNHSKWADRLETLARDDVRTQMLDNVVWIAALLGLTLRWRRDGVAYALLLWFVPTVLVYIGYYYFMPNGPFLRFLLSALPACVLACGLLLTLPPLRWAPVRLAVMAGFALWLWQSPPPVMARLLARAQFARPATPVLIQPDRPNPLRELIAYLKIHPAAVYAHDEVHWTASACPGSISYDLGAWRDRHFLSPAGPQCAKLPVMDDPGRHRWLHEQYAQLGRDGLRKDFVAHLAADVHAGRDVLICPRGSDPALDWLREAGWSLRPVEGVPGTFAVERPASAP